MRHLRGYFDWDSHVLKPVLIKKLLMRKRRGRFHPAGGAVGVAGDFALDSMPIWGSTCWPVSPTRLTDACSIECLSLLISQGAGCPADEKTVSF
eukprot:COSAG01_NODE_32479_length_580_cov_1.395010_2_plen_93_part_01